MAINIDGVEYLTLPEVLELVHMSQASIYERMRYDRFPQPYKPEYRTFWKRSEIEDYIKASKKKD